MSLSFLKHQDIWVDETTQLSGLTLGPTSVVSWLCGENPLRFGVPGDRMPPVSYWMGGLWSGVFGLTEISIRAMGVTAVACAALLIAIAARRAWGKWAGVLAAAVFLFSPNTLVTSVEIRAYPLFLLITAGALFFCVRILEERATQTVWNWFGFAGCCLAGIYTHYYGVVLTGALICGMAAIALWRPELRKPLLASSLAIILCSAGLLFFLMGATQMGSTSSEGLDLGSIERFIYRGLIGHPSLAVYHLVAILGMAAFLMMLAAILFPRHRGWATCWMLVIALLAGCTAAVVAKILIGKFDALSPSYNIWRLPMFAMLAGSVVAIRQGFLKTIGIGAALGILLTGTLASGTIIRNSDVFQHTPHRELVALLKSNSIDTVVYDGAGGWAGAYFPLLYSEGSKLHHVLLEKSKAGVEETLDLPKMQKRIEGELPIRIMLVGAESQNMNDTADMVRRKSPRVQISCESSDFLKSAGYTRISSGTLPAQDAVAYDVYDRSGSSK